jgi:phosphoribosyl 1,2-cyclic phosphodiesterase
MDKLRFFSLGSGSSGNCYFFGNAMQGILVDAGIGSRIIRKALKQEGYEMDQVLGVFVTHDHQDHIKSVGTLAERYNIPVYATQKAHEGMERSYGMTQKLSTSSRRYLENGECVELGDFKVESFPVSHDGSDNAGFFIRYKSHGILLATDLGCVNLHLEKFMRESDIVVFESNYDPSMLRDGGYPYHLKQRITSETGHLSNHTAGAFLSEHWHEELKHIFLCHLSKDNNHPELAFKTVEDYFQQKGLKHGEDVTIVSLKRGISEMVLFEP